MQILTLDNELFSLNNLPDEVDEHTRFAVLDNSDPKEPDFFFMPLVFLESFNAPAMVLRIGNDEVTMPIDWSIAVGDSSSSDVKWYFPKMKNGQLLATPLNSEPKPNCAYFVKEISRQSEIIHLDRIL